MIKPIEERLGEWYPFLKHELDKQYFKKLGLMVAQRRKMSRVYPESNDVFKAYELTPPKEVNCIILGQDPYPNYSLLLDKPVADGLTFSTSDDDKTPTNLYKIHNAIEDDCYDGFYLNFKNDLSYLAKQGVLLLNTSLTVEHNTPLSHNEYGWKYFIESTINILSDRPISIISFGQGAKELVNKCILNEDTQIINVEHPAYAARLGRELEHKNCFSLTNSFIMKHYGSKCVINWGGN
jgi:uracil-DNA glycosylase